MNRIIFALLTTLLIFSIDSLAVDKYWRPINTNFNNAFNWDPVGVPGPGDKVILDHWGNMDCIVHTTVSVGGWLQYDNYTSIASILPGQVLTVGSQGFWMDSGGFYANEQDLYINGSLNVHGGGFLASSATTHVQGNIEINPWPLGGWFTDAGTFSLDGYNYTYLESNLYLNNVVINKPGGYIVGIPDGLNLTAVNNFTVYDGSVNGPGELRIFGDAYFGPGTDNGSAHLRFQSSATNHVTIDKNSFNWGNVIVNKSNLQDSVIVTSSLNPFTLMATPDSLHIEHGRFIVDHPNITFNQAMTKIDPTGLLAATSGTMYINYDWWNNGGTFNHNFGTCIFTAYSYSTINVDGTQDWWNLGINKFSGYSVTVADGDEIQVLNQMDCYDGFLHGANSWLSIQKDMIMHPGADEGSIRVRFVGGETNRYILNQATHLFNHVEINKDSPLDTVFFQTDNTHLATGDGASDHVYVNTGHLAFGECGTHIDWNIKQLDVNSGGTLLAWPGDTYFSHDLLVNGGTFQHNNSRFICDAYNYATFDIDQSIHFYNLVMQKPSGYSVTVADGDTLIIDNRYHSNYGYLNGTNSRLMALDTASFASTHQRGSIHLEFAGSATGNCIYNGSDQLFADVLINKSNPGDRVYFETDNSQLVIGHTGIETCTVRRGTAAFQNQGSYVDWNWINTIVEPEGTFEAFSGDTYCQGNFNETGGEFLHNGGSWIWDNYTYSGVNVTHEMVYHDMEILKPSGYSLSVSTGDSLHILNKFTSHYGYLNGADAFLLVEDTVVLGGSHQRGSAPLEIMGAGTTHFIHSNTSPTFYSIIINKANASDEVLIETTSGNLNFGQNDELLSIVSGLLGYQNYGDQVNMGTGTIRVDGGTWRGPYALMTLNHNVQFLSGNYEHNNGRVQFINYSYGTMQADFTPVFYQFQVAKPAGYTLTITNPGEISVEDTTFFTLGYCHEGSINALGDVVVSPSWNGGSSKLAFMGMTDQSFDLTGAADRYEGIVEINKPMGNVVLQSDFAIEDNFEQLHLVNGLLTSADPSQFQVMFKVFDGWSGGNENSYIQGSAYIEGYSGGTVPIGLNGKFAPAGISNVSTYLPFLVTYYDEDPVGAYGDTPGTGIDHISSCEYWTIDAPAGGVSARVLLSYDTDRCGPVDNAASLVVANFHSGTSTWDTMGQSADDGFFLTSSSTTNNWPAFTLASTNADNPMDGSTAVGCTGDFNGDNVVDTSDLLQMLGGFGCTGSCPHDLNNDGEVNTGDLLLFLGVFGTTC
ncbi:MAG: hypothetical protein KDC12_01765 [Flavobacteriales bacterium]|nr:hypothetical protein [Flavobacteriales bacterium]